MSLILGFVYFMFGVGVLVMALWPSPEEQREAAELKKMFAKMEKRKLRKRCPPVTVPWWQIV